MLVNSFCDCSSFTFPSRSLLFSLWPDTLNFFIHLNFTSDTSLLWTLRCVQTFACWRIREVHGLIGRAGLFRSILVDLHTLFHVQAYTCLCDGRLCTHNRCTLTPLLHLQKLRTFNVSRPTTILLKTLVINIVSGSAVSAMPQTRLPPYPPRRKVVILHAFHVGCKAQPEHDCCVHPS